ncbi:MAG: phage tail assembly protein [Pseudomonadota bacterium]
MAIEIKLRTPIEANGKEHDTLTLREPTLGDLQGLTLFAISQTEGVTPRLGDIAKLIGRLADIPESSSKKIPLRDLLRAGEELMGFLDVSLPTGKK